MRLLVLGGAGFAGAHFVSSALAAGHHVTVFGRGNRLLAEADNLVMVAGNRFKDLPRLAGGSWDATVDFAAFSPRAVDLLAHSLRDAVGHYTLVSTVMTYERTAHPVDENSALIVEKAHDRQIRELPRGWREYGGFKVLAEIAAAEHYPQGVLIIRPGVISGPGDPLDHLAFWLKRFGEGGHILAPGEPNLPVQFIDARDLATWMLHMVQCQATGVFNAAGPDNALTMGDLLRSVSELCGQPDQVSWASTHWLGQQKVRADDAPFFWVRPPDVAELDELWLNYRVCSAKAVSSGLRFRSVSDSLSDNLDWYRSLSQERQGQSTTGWSRSREQQLIEVLRLGHREK